MAHIITVRWATDAKYRHMDGKFSTAPDVGRSGEAEVQAPQYVTTEEGATYELESRDTNWAPAHFVEASPDDLEQHFRSLAERVRAIRTNPANFVPEPVDEGLAALERDCQAAADHWRMKTDTR